MRVEPGSGLDRAVIMAPRTEAVRKPMFDTWNIFNEPQIKVVTSNTNAYYIHQHVSCQVDIFQNN